MIGKVNVSGKKSIDIVNGVIEQYKASTDTIDANSFVEFVISASSGTDTNIWNYNKAASAFTSAFKLSDDKVLLVYGEPYSDSYNYPTAAVCTISNNTITKGTDTRLYSSYMSGIYSSGTSSITEVGDNTFLILYSNNGRRIWGAKISVSGTSITKLGENTSVYDTGSNSYSIAKIRTHYLGENKTLVYAVSSTINYMGFVSTSSSSPGSLSSSTAISSYSTYTAGTLSYLENNKFLATYSMSSSGGTPSGEEYSLRGRIFNVTGTTITVETEYVLDKTKYSGYSQATLPIDKNNVVIKHTLGSTERGAISLIKINGTVLELYSITALPEDVMRASNSNEISNPLYMFGDYIITTYSGYSNLQLIIFKYTKNGILYKNSITILSTTYSGTYVFMVQISDNKIVIFHGYSSSYILYGVVVNLNKKAIASDSIIDGITKEEITTSTAGDVWVLNQ